MALLYIDSGSAPAEVHMERDRQLLAELANMQGRCQLHCYRWQGPSATYGHFCNPHQLLNIHSLEKYRLQLAKRPTGGGLTFHDYDYAFSLLLSADHSRYMANTLDSYRDVHSIVLKAIERFVGKIPHLVPNDMTPLTESCRHFCMAKPTIYDLLLDGRKVAGGAQRRTRHGILHQGTIALTMPPEDFLDDILPSNSGVAIAMQRHSYPLLGPTASPSQLEEARSALQQLLREAFELELG
jgi:lipoate-protein ligase A